MMIFTPNSAIRNLEYLQHGAEKLSFTGCSKRFRYKAPEIPRNESYIEVRRISLPRRKAGRYEGNPAVGGIDEPFCSPHISSHSHPFGAVPGFSNLLIVLGPTDKV